MNATTFRAVLTLPKAAIVRACCRTIVCHHAQRNRSFKTTAIVKGSPRDPIDPVEHSLNPISNSFVPPLSGTELPESSEVIDDIAPATERAPSVEETADAAENDAEKLNASKDKSSYGSAVKRSRRNARKAEESPHVVLPTWFLQRNVRLHQDEDPDIGGRHLGLYSQQNTSTSSSDHGYPSVEAAPDEGLPSVSMAHDESSVPQTAVPPLPGVELSGDSYMIDKHILDEIQTMVAAGLRPPSTGYANGYAASKPVLLLQSPKDGGISFLDTVVKYVAAGQAADVISIDAQDIAELATDYPSDSREPRINPLSSLGYDTHLMMARNYLGNDENMGEEEDYDDGEEEAHPQPRNRQPSYRPQSRATILPVVTIFGKGRLSDFLSSEMVDSGSVSREYSEPSNASARDPSSLPSTVAITEKSKIRFLLEALLHAGDIKRKISLATAVDDASEELKTNSSNSAMEISQAAKHHDHFSIQRTSGQNTIVLIKDYAEMNATRSGGAFLSKLLEVVTKRRKDGQRIFIIGTTSSEDLIPSLSKSGFHDLQTDAYRTIITPCRSPSADSIFGIDMQERIRQINVRHLQNMVRRVAPDLQYEDVVTQSNLDLDSSVVSASGLKESVWSIERMHRAAMMILGSAGEGQELTINHFTRGLTMLDLSDNAKAEWIVHTRDRVQKQSVPISNAKKDLEDRMKKIRRHCNSHEKKLLSGVVDAANIHTTFSDIQAPVDTIEALKTLTMLSLLRPDAFTYGVLATDKIPGLLLYGPPGTGKTLLAKAVAKESGATVLEVSGADVFQMYVGEGEKSVKAIFTLAKKLSPAGGCIIFIDEADAIFGSRGTSSNRTSHRELINQFLREWDGLNDLSAFIMVATNRPFDLDDAVLRRLPRRLLVDLPIEKDREAILQIHLKHENLDSSVSLSHLASQTPFYSGSDLKNLAVAAALACVREENAAAVVHTGSKPYEYPKQRILTAAHFDRALSEISASISEDMSSLSAIRKFDEKYGDRRGRRKTPNGYGFGTMTEMEKSNTDSARIRA
ncbi:hypothetical protein MMC26_002829 [Xylographa opegraphella]|nr:hypothetical protein [Xylographa opegraphella]